MYTYNWYQWLSFFYIYCFIGWIFESAYVTVLNRRFVNRGFLRIPLLPLYGFGAVMMLWVSLPVKDNLLLVYLFGVAAATVLEYVTGSVMEFLFKIRYWDYSDQKFQFHGYICLSSSVVWGFLTILMTEVVHEPVAQMVEALNQNVLFFCTMMISIIFAVDVFASVREALALGKALESMTRLKAEMEDLQLKIAALKEEAAGRLAAVKGGTAVRLAAVKNGTAMRLAAVKDGTAVRLTAVKDGTAVRLIAVKDGTMVRLAAVKDGTAGRLAAVKDGTAGRLAAVRDGTAVRLTAMKDGTAGRLTAMKDGTAVRLTAARKGTSLQMFRMKHTFSGAKSQTSALLSSRLELAKEKRRKLQSPGPIRHFYRKGLLKGNPGAVSTKFSEALKELQKRL